LNSVQPVLIFGYGNPGRGDDALGPEVVDAIEEAGIAGVECQSDMQLQVEHITDLEGREHILFVDADVACAEPYAFTTLEPEKDGSYTSHAMTPGALLHAYKKVYGSDSPPAYILRIRGYAFELGDPMGEQARNNLAAAIELVKKLCADAGEANWTKHLSQDADGNAPASSCPSCSSYTLSTSIENIPKD
jgi:hydrogenase maturation protease